MTNTDVPAHLGSWFLCPPGPLTRPPALTESEPCCTCCVRPSPVALADGTAGECEHGQVDGGASMACPPKPRKPRQLVQPKYVTVNGAFAIAVWKHRVGRRESPSQFAQRAGVEPSILVRVENGKDRRIRDTAAAALAAAAGLDDLAPYLREVA